MVAYKRRILDDELDELLPGLPAISLDGPKGVGKTATALQHSQTVFRLDETATAERLRAQPTLIRQAMAPVLLDEWQRVPEIWDVVRRAVDDEGVLGRFLLTGSAAPVGVPLHSGAGRIVSLRMRPLAFSERGLVQPTISVKNLLDGGTEIDGQTQLNLRDYVEEIVRSGFPGIRDLPERTRRLQLDAYINRIIERDFPEQGLNVRRPETLRSWLSAYAAATATTASYSNILDAATPGLANKPSKEATTKYRDVLSQLWLIDSVPAWEPNNAFARFGTVSKHFLADPALTARLLGLDEQRLLSDTDSPRIGPQDKTRLGSLFESLVALSLMTYAQASESRVHHLRTSGGEHEIDFILRRGDGATIALEVKLASTVSDADVKHLLWLREKLGSDLSDSAVIYTGEFAYRRRDGIAVIPLALLGP